MEESGNKDGSAGCDESDTVSEGEILKNNMGRKKEIRSIIEVRRGGV